MEQERGAAIATTANAAYERMEQERGAAIATTANVAYGMLVHDERVVDDCEHEAITIVPLGSPLTAGPECACEYLIPSSHQPHPLPEATPTYRDGEREEAVYEHIH